MSSVVQKMGLPKIDLPPVLNKIVAVFRREFQDHRTGYFTVPMVITALMILGMIGEILFASAGSINFDMDGRGLEGFLQSLTEGSELLSLDEREAGWSLISMFLFGGLYITLIFVIVFALLSTLFRDRRDKSFLFWKSMPVSDTMEVVIKYCGAVYMAPIIFIGFGIILQFAFAILASLVLSSFDVPVWDMVWAPLPLFSMWPGIYGHFVVWSLWAFPLYTWFIFVSAFAPRAPLMFAVAGPLALVLMEEIVLDTNHLLSAVGTHFAGYSNAFVSIADDLRSRELFEDREYDVDEGLNLVSELFTEFGATDVLAASMSNGGFYGGLILGAAFMAGAIWLRKNRV